MGNILKTGTKNPELPSAYENSMAKAMETAFLEEWQFIMKTDEPKIDDQVRLLFLAVSKGVIKHLADNPGAFIIDVPPASTLTVEVPVKKINNE